MATKIETQRYREGGIPQELLPLLDEFHFNRMATTEEVRLNLIRAWELGQDDIVQALKHEKRFEFDERQRLFNGDW
jgi:hypothetical protein